MSIMACEANNLADMFLRRVKLSANRPASMSKVDGQWLTTTWKGFYNQAASVACFLLKEELKLGDRICILGSTRAEWGACDMGGLLAGIVTVGAYPTLTSKQLAHILEHSDSRILFVENQAALERILPIRKQLSVLQKIVIWDTAGLESLVENDPTLLSWSDVLMTPIERAKIDKRNREIDPSATAIIVYTSGTTGPPKGAMLSHRNILSVLAEQKNLIEAAEDELSLSFLPMAHVAERIISFYGRISGGVAAAYASSISALLDELIEVRPTVFGAVPRIFEKAYAKIMSQVEKMPRRRQQIFRWAEETGRQVVRLWQAGKPIPLLLRVQHKVADRLVFSKIRAAFGGRVRQCLVGAAPISMEILEFFWGAGFPIYELYGMTENTVVSHANREGAVRLGSVGQALSFLEAKLADDNEILLRAPTVFLGYHKDPEATKEAVDIDGWLHTGDVGRIDDDGYLYIVDRKKHIIITAGGKNIAPANVESELKSQDHFISQVHVHGDKKPYLTALITIHPMEAVEWAEEQGLIEKPRARVYLKELMTDPSAQPKGLSALMEKVTSTDFIRGRVIDAVRRGNRQLAKVETVKRVLLLRRDLSIQEDEVTPTLKVKRKEIEKKFATQFIKLYKDPSFGLIIEETKGKD